MLQNGASKLAFLDEPDLPGETMLDAGTAAHMWLTYAIPMRQDKDTYLISPAVTTNSRSALLWHAATRKQVPRLACTAQQMPAPAADAALYFLVRPSNASLDPVRTKSCAACTL